MASFSVLGTYVMAGPYKRKSMSSAWCHGRNLTVFTGGKKQVRRKCSGLDCVPQIHMLSPNPQHLRVGLCLEMGL